MAQRSESVEAGRDSSHDLRPVSDVDSLDEVTAQSVAFSELTPTSDDTESTSLDKLRDVKVKVAAELGRIEMEIGDVLKLHTGSVVKLDRSVFEPVDLLVQGVCLARGEVVVVDDRFAVRIKEIIALHRH